MSEEEVKITRTEVVQAQPVHITITKGLRGQLSYEISLFGSDPDKMIDAAKSIADRINLEFKGEI